MKVLIIIDSLGSGGAERSTEVLCDYLAEREVDFQLLALDERKVGVQARMEAKGYDISFLRKRNFFLQVKEITGFIKRGDYDLVNSILFRSNLRTRFAKAITRFLHLESLVNTTYSKERLLDKQVNHNALKVFKFLDKLSASRCVDHFHSITETVKIHYIKQIGLKPARITVVPRGRKPIIARYEERPAKTNKKVKIINVGRHEFQKGQIYLLKAAKVLKEKGYDFQLDIYGREGTVTPELKNFVKSNYLHDCVHLAGYSSNIPDLLLQSDIFAFSSLYEGLGGALIEAQAAGLPVVCNDIKVLNEVVKADENGKFFDVHQPASIVEALSFFIKNPEKRIEYGKKSLQNYQNRFQEAENNRKLLELYVKLSNNYAL